VEQSIKRTIEVDKEAQKIINEAKASEETYKQDSVAIKKELKEKYWSEATKLVEGRKKELSTLIEGATQRNTDAHQIAIDKIDEMFDKKESQWKKELISRCLGNNHE